MSIDNEIDFDLLEKEDLLHGLPDIREKILKAGHFITYPDPINATIFYVEYPDLMRYTLPMNYIPLVEEYESRQFKHIINQEKRSLPCYNLFGG